MTSGSSCYKYNIDLAQVNESILCIKRAKLVFLSSVIARTNVPMSGRYADIATCLRIITVHKRSTQMFHKSLTVVTFFRPYTESAHGKLKKIVVPYLVI